MKLSKIVKDYREAHGLTQEAMGQLCDVTKAYISMIENERNSKTKKKIIPTIETLSKLANGMNMDVDKLVRMMDEDAVISLRPSPFYNAVRIPVLGRVVAGIPIEATEDILGYEEITEHMAKTGEFFALRVKGDSMVPKFATEIP